MKATPKAIGKMPCMCCGEYITVKQADTGTVSVSCPDCDFSGYGKAGTDAHKIIMGKVTLKRPDTPAAIAAPAAPAPAARKPTAPASKTAPAAPAAPVRNTLFG